MGSAMASWYYLVAQLPSLPDKLLVGAVPLPMTDVQFLELAGRFLDSKSLGILKALTLVPPEIPKKTGSHVVDTWNATERALRIALAQLRAQKLKKNFDITKAGGDPVPVSFSVLQASRTAMSLESPLAAEQFLNDFRLDLLASLSPQNYFSTDTLYLYALKLKLFERIRKFSKDAGIASYKTIYDQILGETA
jgi:hypothetical protein